MKAVRMHGFGGVEVLRYEDVPVPTPGAGEVLVRVRAAGVNPVDWKLRDGMGKGMITPPYTPGFDVSGTVEATDGSVTEYKKGDEVYAYLPITRGGGYAEFAVVSARDLARKPQQADHTHAAAVPLAALTAWQAMFDRAKLQPGQTVLIHGAAGGVGHFAVQMAVAKGAKVIATASARNLDFVRGLGAGRVIDHNKEKFEEVARDVDVVFDMIGGDTLARSYAVLKEGGYLVSIVAAPDASKLADRKANGSVFLVQPNGMQLGEIAALIDSGKIKPDVSATFGLNDAARAQERSKSGGSGRGKIVLTVP
ncbi:MAG: NADP-dependent oxidoreductase [Phycisphaerae bacterium]|nr:NADP-dependent oxidoreductase [Phycisphaerae bacterium]